MHAIPVHHSIIGPADIHAWTSSTVPVTAAMHDVMIA